MELSADEFYALTPRLFVAMRKEWQAKQRETQRMVALLRMDVINFSMRAPKDQVKLSDLLPGDGEKLESERPQVRKMTAKLRREIAESFRRTMQGFVGR